MKIQNPYGIQPDPSVKKGSSEQQGSGSVSFSDLLKGVGQSNEKAAASRPSELSGVEAVGRAAPSAGLDQIQQAALARGEELLGLLESLSTILDRGGIHTDDMDALASGLKEKVQQLQESKLRLDMQDPLRSTLDEIQILSQVEYMKIARGDYSS